jgi:hypothetical protein
MLCIASIYSALCAAITFIEENMKYDFSLPLRNVDGSPAMDAVDKPALIRTACINALISDPQGITSDLKARRYALFVKLQKEGTDLTVEEVSLLKQAIEVFPTLVYGQLAAFLDQTE